MQTRKKEFVQPRTIAFTESDMRKLDSIQNHYLIDRSNIIRVLLYGLTIDSFDKLLRKQILSEKKKRMVKRKIATKRK